MLIDPFKRLRVLALLQKAVGVLKLVRWSRNRKRKSEKQNRELRSGSGEAIHCAILFSR
jgi:hypothetical protein